MDVDVFHPVFICKIFEWKKQKNWKWKNVKKNKRKNISHLLVNYLPSFLIIISLLSSFFFLSPPGSDHVSHSHSPAQLSQGGRSESSHPLRGAGQSSHRGRIRTLQQPHGLQHHQPEQYDHPHTHTRALGSTGDAWRFPVTLPTNEGSGLTVVTANANWRLSQMKRPSFSLSSADVCCVCVCVWRWPSEVGAGPAASHRGLGLRWSGGDCCHGGYRCCLP